MQAQACSLRAAFTIFVICDSKCPEMQPVDHQRIVFKSQLLDTTWARGIFRSSDLLPDLKSRVPCVYGGANLFYDFPRLSYDATGWIDRHFRCHIPRFQGCTAWVALKPHDGIFAAYQVRLRNKFLCLNDIHLLLLLFHLIRYQNILYFCLQYCHQYKE